LARFSGLWVHYVIAIPLSAGVVHALTSRVDAIGIDILVPVKRPKLAFVLAKPCGICRLHFFRVRMFGGELGADTDEQVLYVRELRLPYLFDGVLILRETNDIFVFNGNPSRIVIGHVLPDDSADPV